MPYTKGNWTVKPQIEKKKHASMFYVISDGGKCSECGKDKDYRHICVSLESAVGMEQAKANAKLIATAPELLDACIEAKAIIYNLYNNLEKRKQEELQAIFDKVIKKAIE